MSKRKSKQQSDLDTFFHALGVAEAPTNDDALLASMIGNLDLDEDGELPELPSEIIVPDDMLVDPLAAAVADIERAEAIEAVYEEQDREAQAEALFESAADKPSTDTVAEAEAPAKTKKAKAPKTPRVTSVSHKPGDRLVAQLGADYKDFLVFYKSDDAASAETRVESFVTAMNDRDAIADKVKDKAVMLLTWLKAGKDTSELNEVLRRAFNVLFRDGELTSGKAGNLQLDLLSKPYSPGTSASQANQMFMLFPILGITQREKGRMVVNPDSTIAEAMKLKLGVAA
jgi:hypothetical protein